MRILNVDDNPGNRYLLESVLHSAGHQVVSASHGIEALERLGAGGFDLIVSDVLMPRMDGFQLCREVKRREETRQIPFLFYTATYTDRKDEELGLSLGAARFILKPQEPEVLLALLEAARAESCQPSASPAPAPPRETEFLKNYSQRLVTKLEQKIEELETSSRDLRLALLKTEEEVQERRRTEQRLLTSLEEKDALLKEVHHRVKNNLQIVSSLLSLQSAQVEQPQALTVLRDTQSRVRSMALLHESLYRSTNLARIAFAPYCRSLCVQIFQSFGVSPTRIHLERRIDDVTLAIDQAVPCGLIINELVSNSLKHAFPDERSGRITLELRAAPDGVTLLRIADDGVGLPPGFDLRRSKTLGLQLAFRLARQLRGALEIEPGAGASFLLTFHLPPEALPAPGAPLTTPQSRATTAPDPGL